MVWLKHERFFVSHIQTSQTTHWKIDVQALQTARQDTFQGIPGVSRMTQKEPKTAATENPTDYPGSLKKQHNPKKHSYTPCFLVFPTTQKKSFRTCTKMIYQHDRNPLDPGWQNMGVFNQKSWDFYPQIIPKLSQRNLPTRKSVVKPQTIGN